MLFQFFYQFRQGFNSLAPSKRIAVIFVGALSLISICAFVFFVNQKEYSVLFSNLPADDAGKIIARLQEKKVPYKLSSSGDCILIPSENVPEMRIDLASSGLPHGGVVGFEIFDNRNIGVTDFVQQMNYQRALQGELSRTISDLDEIQMARVHIVMPKKSLFIENQTKSTASVFIKLKPGKKLGASQIDGIVHLVASSVEGLCPEEVMVVDSGGTILSRANAGSQVSKKTNFQIECQRNIEEKLAYKIQSMVARVVGEDKVIARVSTTLDFRVMEKTEEFYDSEEPAIRSRHIRTEKSTAPFFKNGQSAIKPANKQVKDAYGTDHEKMDETVNYEINRTISKTVMPVGEITKLSVAVLVDGVYRKNDKGMEEFQPRSKKEMTALEDIVKKAVGFDAGRGDQIVVKTVPFRDIEPEMGPVEEESWKDKTVLFLPLIKYIISLLAVIFVFIFILRPLVQSLLVMGRDHGVKMKNEELSAPDAQPDIVESSPLSLKRTTREVSEEIELVKDMASHNASDFADVLRGWLG